MITIPVGPVEHVRKPKLTIQTSMSGDGRRLYMVNSVDMMEFRKFMDYALHSTGRYIRPLRDDVLEKEAD